MKLVYNRCDYCGDIYERIGRRMGNRCSGRVVDNDRFTGLSFAYGSVMYDLQTIIIKFKNDELPKDIKINQIICDTYITLWIIDGTCILEDLYCCILKYNVASTYEYILRKQYNKNAYNRWHQRYTQLISKLMRLSRK